MKFYQEIRLIDGEQSLYTLWSLLYGQLHFCLATLGKSSEQNVGVSFPNYIFKEHQQKSFTTLGDKLRLFADDEAQLKHLVDDLKIRLTQYGFKNDADAMADNFHFKRIQAVPEMHDLVVVKRYRRKDPMVQAKNYAEHKGVSLEEAIEHCKQFKRPQKDYPFIVLKSKRNDAFYRLGIIQASCDNALVGSFNSYGINNPLDNVTVPHW
ncbi:MULTISPECIES: type I-F CRISPR-associated endoribonuclease Cas6/Csy4 [unclassified Acinetobacter]|uniref:type I-F CRISPR-associated endoribonuclease Cas6/Csy4 n=1 Tax=unclassified Acinetobacter TaxID=196816 RepID=UPI0035B7180F